MVFGTPDAEVKVYAAAGGNTPLSPNTVAQAGGQGAPHENRQPYQTVNYIIALQGLFPPRS